LPLLAAEKLGVRLGLWENTTTITMSGMSVPADAMANMPPAQRAQMEQMMKQMGVGAPRTIKEKSCITEKDLADGAFRQRSAEQDMNCKYTVVTSTSKKQETTFQCTASASKAEGRMTVEAVDDKHIKGNLQMKSPQASIDAKFDGQWLGADCGTTK